MHFRNLTHTSLFLNHSQNTLKHNGPIDLTDAEMLAVYGNSFTSTMTNASNELKKKSGLAGKKVAYKQKMASTFAVRIDTIFNHFLAISNDSTRKCKLFLFYDPITFCLSFGFLSSRLMVNT